MMILRPLFFCACMALGALIPLKVGAQLNHYQTMQPASSMDFPFYDAEGKEHRLKDYRGRIVMVNFWASWCPPCVGELPSLQNLAETFPSDEFVILAVSRDAVGKQEIAKKLFSGRMGEAMSLFFDNDGGAAKALEVKALPTTVVFDREGRLVGRLKGATLWDHHEVLDLIQAYIEGRTPQPLSWWQRFKKTLFGK